MTLMEQFAGAVVMVLTLLDIFLTVLYARAGTALFSPFVSRGIWFYVEAVSGSSERLDEYQGEGSLCDSVPHTGMNCGTLSRKPAKINIRVTRQS